MNKRTHWCEVSSYRPYEGKVEVEMYENNNLFVRIPGWVNKPDVTVMRNGNSIDVKWSGDYITASDLKTGDKFTVNYPMR